MNCPHCGASYVAKKQARKPDTLPAKGMPAAPVAKGKPAFKKMSY